MNIIVCLTPIRQFGKVDKEEISLVENINEATKFTEDYKEEMTYLLNMFREKYVASSFVCCNIQNVVFDEPIQNILEEHIDSKKLSEVLY